MVTLNVNGPHLHKTNARNETHIYAGFRYVHACSVPSIVSNSLRPQGCRPPGPSVHGDSPGKNTGVGSHARLQGIFPTQGSNSCPLHWQIFTTSTTWVVVQRQPNIQRNRGKSPETDLQKYIHLIDEKQVTPMHWKMEDFPIYGPNSYSYRKK